MTYKIRTNIYLPIEQRRLLKIKAVLKNVSMATLIREAIEIYLAGDTNDNNYILEQTEETGKNKR